MFIPRYLEQSLALMIWTNDVFHYLLVKFLEAELCEQFVCKLNILLYLGFLGSAHFCVYSISIIQIIAFEKVN